MTDHTTTCTSHTHWVLPSPAGITGTARRPLTHRGELSECTLQRQFTFEHPDCGQVFEDNLAAAAADCEALDTSRPTAGGTGDAHE